MTCKGSIVLNASELWMFVSSSQIETEVSRVAETHVRQRASTIWTNPNQNLVLHAVISIIVIQRSTNAALAINA
jgi:hypothetical protein